MFYILRKDFNGRVFDQFFKEWSNAQKEMDEGVKRTILALDGHLTETRNYFDTSEGFQVYEKTAAFSNGEKCTWAIINGNFQD